jgi:hypothetical protein
MTAALALALLSAVVLTSRYRAEFIHTVAVWHIGGRSSLFIPPRRRLYGFEIRHLYGGTPSPCELSWVPLGGWEYGIGHSGLEDPPEVLSPANAAALIRYRPQWGGVALLGRCARC